MSRPRNPLEPLATVVGALLLINIVLIIISTIATVLGFGSVMGFGASSVHVDVPDIFSDANLRIHQFDPLAGVTVNTTGYRLFAPEPDIVQRLWYSLTLLPNAVLFTGALLLVYRLVRGAERGGIFTSATARRLRSLGWFLLLGGVVEAVVENLAANRLLATMVTNQVDWISLNSVDLSWSVLLTAVGLLSFARIMRIGAQMHEELEATV